MLFVNIYVSIIYDLKSIAFMLRVVYIRGSLRQKETGTCLEPKFSFKCISKRPYLRDGSFSYLHLKHRPESQAMMVDIVRSITS
jgi:hypothetical protein